MASKFFQTPYHETEYQITDCIVKDKAVLSVLRNKGSYQQQFRRQL